MARQTLRTPMAGIADDLATAARPAAPSGLGADIAAAAQTSAGRPKFEGRVPPATSLADAEARRAVLEDRAKRLGIGSKFGQTPTSTPAPTPTPSEPATRLGAMADKAKGFTGGIASGAKSMVKGLARWGMKAAAVPLAWEAGRAAIDFAGDAVGRAAGLDEYDIQAANRRLGARTGGLFGEGPPAASAAPAPQTLSGLKPSAPAGGAGGAVPPAAAGGMRGSIPPSEGFAPTSFTRMGPADAAAMNTSLRAGTNDIPRPGTGTIVASDGSSGTRIDASGERDRIMAARNAKPPSVFGEITEQNNARYDDRKDRAWYGLETARLGATATNNVARARLGMEMGEKAAKSLNESIDRWATVPNPDGKGGSGVDPTRRNQINTFITEALTGQDGRLPQGLLDDPRVIDRVMPTIIQALDQGVEVNDLAKNPGFMRTIWDSLGITSPSMTTSGDYRITGVRKATLGDAITNKDVGLTDWAVGRPVGQTDTGVVRTMRDFNANDVQRLRGTQRRLPE